jgi:hypothetical protein
LLAGLIGERLRQFHQPEQRPHASDRENKGDLSAKFSCIARE